MTSFTLRGIPISFPFEPYDIQKDYMSKVLECLETETNGVLESPTGTGKTLSLLCSSLAWLQYQKAQCQLRISKINNDIDDPDVRIKQFRWDVPKIIYSSRTHSQLAQVMQELKRTAYRHFKATVIGSRDQMCIHPEVSKETNNSQKTLKCRALVSKRACHLQNRVEKLSSSQELNDLSIIDIEDIVSLGRKMNFCPYYMSKEVTRPSDIIFMPYNYLLDPKARRAQQIELKNSIVILDEAHNVEHVCQDSVSFQIKSTDIALCIDEVNGIYKTLEEASAYLTDIPDFTAEDVCVLKQCLINLENAVDGIEIKNKFEGVSFGGNFMFELFEKAGINQATRSSIMILLDKLIQFMSTNRDSPFQRTGNGLQLLLDSLVVIFQSDSEQYRNRVSECCKVHIFDEEPKKSTNDNWLSKATSKKTSCRVVSLWCLSPGFGMQLLLKEGVKCVILTSGTLAPLKPLISELGIEIGVRLENPHVVKKEQACIKVITNGADGELFNSTYNNRDNPKYLASLGLSIVNIARMVPNGLLIFFSSYALLDKCRETWINQGIWGNIDNIKRIFIESKRKEEFSSDMQEYYRHVKDPQFKGAIFMAVLRGKVSEGMDFADINGRAVIIIGMPFPPFKDPRVVLKRNYLDTCNAKNKEYLTGQEWYCLEASRAVNQAIGRVIRHANDYGAILLLDARFKNISVQNQISKWLRDRITIPTNFGQILREMKLFFKSAAELTSNEKPQESITVPEDNASSSASLSKEDNNEPLIKQKTKKFKLTTPNSSNEEETAKSSVVAYMTMVKRTLLTNEYYKFTIALSEYKNTSNIDSLIEKLDEIFISQPTKRYLLQGLSNFMMENDKEKYLSYWNKMR